LTTEAALDRTLAALADPSRRRMIELLRDRPRSAGELAEAAGLSPPSASRHLKTLRQAGMVQESHPEFDARVRIYTLKADGLEALKSWLAETER
jgi:DNA-binding transcriptional ArsR family regulator